MFEVGPLNVASLGDSEGSRAVPGFSGCRWGNREPGTSSWERRQVQGGLGIFSASEGWGFGVAFQKASWWSQIAILLFLSVTPPWLLASGLGNTCWSSWGPCTGSGC